MKQLYERAYPSVEPAVGPSVSIVFVFRHARRDSCRVYTGWFEAFLLSAYIFLALAAFVGINFIFIGAVITRTSHFNNEILRRIS